MGVLDAGTRGEAGFWRCHLWCWVPARTVEWERRTLIVGGLSPFGLVAAGVSAVVSAAGNRRRRDEALCDAGPKWRYIASGFGSVIDGRLVVQEWRGVEQSFDLVGADRVESPAPGWLRVTAAGSSAPWAIQLTEPSGRAG